MTEKPQFNGEYLEHRQANILRCVALEHANKLVVGLVENGIVRTERKAIKSLKKIFAENLQLLTNQK